ncbi:MAG: TrkA family potassium uptake protein [Haloferacaceae archaeon]
MMWRRRRSLQYLLLLTGTTLGFTLLYNHGMAAWEDEPQTLLHSLEVVVQTFTTTGYGEDAPWTTPGMHLTVVAMQLAGVGLILTAADVFVVPFLRRTLSSSPPSAAPDAADHVVVCRHTPRTDALAAELDARDVPYVVVDSDREPATELHEAGVDVVEGDPKSAATLRAASVEAARAVVVDADDETSANVVLAARQVSDDLPVVSLVEDQQLAPYHRYAGASETLSPRQLVGERLAAKVTSSLGPADETVDGVVSDLEIVEVSIRQGSVLADRTLESAPLPAGVHVVGAWMDGEFVSPVSPETTLDESAVLVVAGDEDAVDRLRSVVSLSLQRNGRGDVLVVGRGQTGAAAATTLAEAGIDYTVLDVEDKEGVDVVGDATDPAVLERVAVAEKGTVVLALGDDATTIFTALIVRERYPDVEIVARASEAENVPKMYQAGVHFVLALAQVSGRMLASTLLGDEAVVAAEREVSFAERAVPELAGRTLADADVRARTGCSVVAVERDGEWVTGLTSDFEFRTGDRLLVAGTDDSLAAFEREFA